MKTRQTLPRIAYRPDDAAEVLGVSRRTLDSWQSLDDPPPCVKVNGVKLFPHDGLAEWLRRQISGDLISKQSD